MTSIWSRSACTFTEQHGPQSPFQWKHHVRVGGRGEIRSKNSGWQNGVERNLTQTAEMHWTCITDVGRGSQDWAGAQKQRASSGQLGVCATRGSAEDMGVEVLAEQLWFTLDGEKGTHWSQELKAEPKMSEGNWRNSHLGDGFIEHLRSRGEPRKGFWVWHEDPASLYGGSTCHECSTNSSGAGAFVYSLKQ